jgi:hypothetical protein
VLLVVVNMQFAAGARALEGHHGVADGVDGIQSSSSAIPKNTGRSSSEPAGMRSVSGVPNSAPVRMAAAP